LPVQSTLYPRVFALAVAALLGYALLLIFMPFAGPIAWAAFLAFLLFPLNVRLRRRFRGRSGLAAGLLTIFAPIVVLLPLAALSIEFVSQISALLRKLQTATAGLDIKTYADLQQFPLIAHLNLWLQAHSSFSAEQVQGWIIQGTREILEVPNGLRDRSRRRAPGCRLRGRPPGRRNPCRARGGVRRCRR